MLDLRPPRALLLVTLTALTPTAACSDDATALPDTARACGRPVSRGYWEEGGLRLLATDRQVCLCMTEEEFESLSRLDELNEYMLEVCEQHGEFFEMDWTDCAEDFASKAWIGEEGEKITWPTGNVVYPPGSALSCY